MYSDILWLLVFLCIVRLVMEYIYQTWCFPLRNWNAIFYALGVTSLSPLCKTVKEIGNMIDLCYEHMWMSIALFILHYLKNLNLLK